MRTARRKIIRRPRLKPSVTRGKRIAKTRERITKLAFLLEKGTRIASSGTSLQHIEVNKKVNAINLLDRLRLGREKGGLSAQSAQVWGGLIKEDALRTLGYGDILRMKGPEKALDTYYAERDVAEKMRKAKRK